MKKTIRLATMLLALASFGWLVPQAGAIGTTNILQWAFTNTSGTVTAPIADTSGQGHNANNIIGTGIAPTYSPDIPTNTQFCTGVGSVSFAVDADTGISTGPLGLSALGYPTAAQIVAAGGLTMEVWVKNPAFSTVTGNTTPAIAFGWGGVFNLGVSSGGYLGFFNGYAGTATTWSTTNWHAGEWIHVAAVLTQPNSAASVYTNITTYVNGTAVTSAASGSLGPLNRHIACGLHEAFDKNDAYAGQIYEPRMTLGALSPSKFTILNPPTVAMSSPTNTQVFSAPAGVPLSVNVVSNGYAITSVNYYSNGVTQVATSSTGPNYTANWTSVPVGNYSLTAVAVHGGGSVTSAPVNITVNSQVSTPTFTPVAGGYIGAQNVTISCATAGAAIHYTTDGSTPTSGSPVYTSALTVPVNTTETIKAYATAGGYSDSAVASATYVTAATATWTNPASGSWNAGGNWLNGVIGNASGCTNFFNTLTLGGDTTVTLDSSPTAGMLRFGDVGNFYGWTVNAGSPAGTLTLASATTPVIQVDNMTTTIGAPVAGTSGLLKTGAGTLVLSGANTYTGSTTVSAGALQAGAAIKGLITLNDANTGTNDTGFNIASAAQTNSITVANQGSGTSTIAYVVPGGAQNYGSSSATLTLNRNTTLTAPNLSSGSYMIWNPAVAGSVPLTITNTVNSRLILAGANWPAYTGDIVVQDAAILEPRGALTSATGNSVTVESGGKMQVRFGTPTTINALNGAGTVECLNSATLLTVGKSNGSGTFSGILQNNGAALSLTKTGTGTQILTGANNYTGATTVSGGTLELDAFGSLSGTLVTVQGGGTLAGNGGYIYSSVNLNSSGTLAVNTAVDTNAAVGALTINALSLNTGCTNFLRITKTGGTPASDAITGTGASALGYAGTLKVVDITSDATALALGDTFTLFPSWTSRSGSFSSITLPALPTGLSWDTSQLTAGGSITVSNVLANPTFSPAAGTYVGAQTVIISSTTPGATLYYTTDGSTPTSGSPSGITPVSVNVPVGASSMQIQAYAHAAGYTDSGVASATYSVPEAVAVWTNATGFAWSDASSWTNNLVPNNIGAPVDFSQVTLPYDAYVSLDLAATVGSLTFGDLDNTYAWTLGDGGVGPLTLNNGTNKPSITVLNQKTTITANLVGGNGLKKLGAGTLVLSGANTYSGGTTVSQGPLEVVNEGSANSDPITLGDASTGANDVHLLVDANIDNDINVSTNGTGLATIEYTQTGTFQNPSVLTLNRATTLVATNQAGDAKLWGGIHGNVGTLTLICSTNGRLNLEGSVVGGQYTFTGTVDLASGNLEVLGPGLGAGNPLVMAADAILFLGDQAYIGPTTIGSLNGAATSLIATRHDGGTYNNQLLSLGHGNGSGTFSGVIADGAVQLSLIKAGSGTQTLSGTNTYTGATTVSNGTLLVNGTLGSSEVTVVAGAILGGTGTLGGGTTVAGTLSPGASVGTLSFNSSLALSGNVLIEVNKALAPSNDIVNVTGVLSYGGTLTATNIGGTALVAGDSFPVFPAGGTGSITLAGSPGAGLNWNFNAASGVLSVVGSMATNPTNITYSVSSGQLTLGWPENHRGWKLQAQTNSLSTGLTGAWHDLGYTGTNQATFPVDATQPTVFYRLTLP